MKPWMAAGLCGLLLVVLPGLSAASTLSLTYSGRAVGEVMRVASLKERTGVERFAGDKAWTRNRLELAFAGEKYRLAYVHRYDYSLTFSPGTADFYYRYSNDLPYPQEDVDIRFSVWHSHAGGFKLSRRFEGPSGTYFTPSLYAMRGLDFQDGHLSGTLRADGRLLKGLLDLHYHYSEDWLFDHRAARPAGWGVGLDLSLGWQGEQSSFQVEWQDAWGFMQWQQAPYSEGRVNTVTRSGLPGYTVSMNAAFQGRRFIHPYRQRLQPYVQGMYQAWRGAWGGQLEAEHFMGDLHWRPGVLWRNQQVQLSLSRALDGELWVLGVASRRGGWQWRVGSDGAFSRSGSLLLEGGWRWQW